MKWYRWYVLFVMFLVYAANALDRVVVSVLAPYIKHDLHISDMQIGLLFGTTFALFLGVCGVPLAKLADGWSRVRTLALGLTFWSLMTSLSGFATSYSQLLLARIGVAVGETSSSPAAVSILGDYFGKSQRSTILSLYTAGAYAGAGGALIVGSAIVGRWATAYGGTPPLGLAGWQAAFIGVGLPGIVLAIVLIVTVREPPRGIIDGRVYASHTHPFKEVLKEAATMFPPWSLIGFHSRGKAAQMWSNAALLLAIPIIVIGLTHVSDGLLSPERRAVIGHIGRVAVTSNLLQWSALGIATYAVGSWIQSIRTRDPVTHRLIAASPTFIALTLSCALFSLAMYGVQAFVVLYAHRYLAFATADGLRLGSIATIAGALGMVSGGLLGDFLKRRHLAGRIYVAMGALLGFAIAIFLQYTTEDKGVFLEAYAAATLFITGWMGCINASCQDIVLARMRGVAFAVYSLGGNFIGLGLGPYAVGLISDVTGNLRMALLSMLATVPLNLGLLWFASGRIGHDEATVSERARFAGEGISDDRPCDHPKG